MKSTKKQKWSLQIVNQSPIPTLEIDEKVFFSKLLAYVPTFFWTFYQIKKLSTLNFTDLLHRVLRLTRAKEKIRE